MGTTRPGICGLTPREVGSIGEFACARFLGDRGCEVLERNWRCPLGEVDLVVSDEGELALVEVKTRLAPGGVLVVPELAVDAEKLRRYRTLAAAYLGMHPQVDDLRFDVCGVSIVGEHEAKVRYYENVWLGGEL